MMNPDYIFETSWEVCNRVGGIYAVLSTRAASMQAEHPDKVIFFGPDFGDHSNIYFREDKNLFNQWNHSTFSLPFREGAGVGLPIRVGRWAVPGNPVAVLLKFDALWPHKDEIYAWAWEKFRVQSHAAYGDYDESCLFGYAAGMVMESLYRFLKDSKDTKDLKDLKVCAHANEWQTAFSVFYLRDHCPGIATLFTTHATSIGRSIAGNGKPLYDYFEAYNGDQMAQELNMVSKHSAEKQAAHFADCFTTVSYTTARECKQLLDKEPDIETPNGFEPTYVPKGKAFDAKRKEAREALRRVAGEQLGGTVPENALLVAISGRLEWKNKGIDVFTEALDKLAQKIYHSDQPEREVVAFVMVPYLDRAPERKYKVSTVYVPYYLDSHDPLFGKTYYDLLIGMDITVFPSYYEPWGYTPLESCAFHVPTVTTTLAGFGEWAARQNKPLGVTVIYRNDSNFNEVAEQVADTLFGFNRLNGEEKAVARKEAESVAKKADWKHFFRYYREAYDIALRKAQSRNPVIQKSSKK
ncbi:MAG: glycogen/starch synthase [Paludibacteraceae bacterium]|nr:glycogen/starch synthase [Paludibacteraceae bacterium]